MAHCIRHAVSDSEFSVLNKLISSVRRVGPQIGLVLNEDKCEIVTDDVSVVASMKAVMPNIRHIPRSDAVFLGAPVGDETSVDTVLGSKLAVFRRLASRLTSLNAHDALFLLKNCFRAFQSCSTRYAVLHVT